MGQYFKAVNLDKKEVVCPWCVGGVAKLWEWAAGNHGAIFTLLLRQSSAGGGGDFYGYSTQKIELDSTRPESVHETLLGAFGKVAGIEGQPIDPQPHSIVGRWAGDRIALVGDYDSSKIWDELPKYTNISEDLVRDWNSFIEIPERRLTFNRECSCNDEK